jgi:hypothetical protein
MPEPNADATERLMAVLEATIAKLMSHAQPEHRFRCERRPVAAIFGGVCHLG